MSVRGITPMYPILYYIILNPILFYFLKGHFFI